MLNIILNGIIIVFSLGLLAISILSYRRFRNKKLLFVSGVFLLFFVKSTITVLSFFVGSIPKMDVSIHMGIIDLAIMILLYLATLQR